MSEQDPRDLWAKAPRSLIDRRWKQTHLLVYLYLDLHAGRRGWWRTTQDVIAADLGFSIRAVEAAVPDLRDGGLITTERHGKRGGEITYGIVARVPHDVAVPMPEVPQSGAGRFRSVVRNPNTVSSSQRSKTSTTEEDPIDQAMKIHRARARRGA